MIRNRIVIAVSLLALRLSAQSQLGTGAITGTVSDPSGASVLDAQVTVLNNETGLARRTTTGSAGQFSVPVLPPGNYTVHIETPGFAILEQKDVVVHVGANAAVIAKLQLGTTQQIVDVPDQAIVDTVRTEEVSLVNFGQIQDLPINGRRADQFALLSPGVAKSGPYGLLSYRGMSSVFNNFMLEGNDDNQAYNAEARGRTRIASNVSANAVQEFQVGKSNFLAEFGRAVGGSINAVVRSGTNTFHGDGFYYYRDDNFNATDPIGRIKTPERRQQFGGSASGPIRRDKLFYFVNYDQQVRNFPLLTVDSSGALTNGRPAPGAPAADTAAWDAATKYILSKFPGGAPGNALPRTFNQNLSLAKVDWLLNSTNVFSATYNYLNARALNGIQTGVVTGSTGSNGSDDVRIHSLNLRLTSTLSPRSVNEVRFQWGRDFEYEFANQPPPNVAVGSFAWGRATYLERYASPDERRLQFVDNLSRIIGRHSFKFGGEVNRVRDIINNPANFGGAYSYSNALLFGRDLLGQTTTPNYTSFSQSFGLPGISFKSIDYAGFVQDQWRARKNLTFNYGLRYDYQALPKPSAPNPAFPETQKFNADRLNFGPRAGAAWDIRSNGKTVIRGGYGMFFARTPNGQIDNALRQTGLADPTKATISVRLTPTDPGAPRFPNVLTSPVGASTTVTRVAVDFRRPRAQEINAGVERQIMKDTTLSVSYIYTKGDRQPLNYDTNLPTPAFTRTYLLPDGTSFQAPFSAGIIKTADGKTQNLNASRPNPNYGAISVVRSIGQSWYNAMFIEMRRRFSNGTQVHLAYTLSRAENLSGGGYGDGGGAESAFGGSSLLDQFKLLQNRARASTDQHHRLVADGVWNLPFGRTGSSVGSRLIRHFRLSGIFTAESGRPYSSGISASNVYFTGPDGAQYNGFGGILGQGGLSLLPNVKRNSNTGWPNYRVDLRVARDFRLKERLTVEVLGEGFNVFNHANYNGYNSTLYYASSSATSPVTAPVQLTTSSNFGVPNGDQGPPDGTNARRFQLALRFRF